MTDPFTTARVPGHELRAEGAAHVDRCGRPYRESMRLGGTGFAVCSCGARSETLDSNPKRKQWHREHKAAVLAEADR